jgi:hypothetical protein
MFELYRRRHMTFVDLMCKYFPKIARVTTTKNLHPQRYIYARILNVLSQFSFCSDSGGLD